MMLEVALSHPLGALRLDLRFAAPPGVTALFGPSGAGKTSVINAVAGLLRPETGRIACAGEVLLDTARGLCLPPEARRVGYVFQDARLFPHLDVRANLTYGARFAPRGATGPGFDQIVALLGLEALLARRPAALSGGEKARVAIGRALLSKPRILLLDEPLAALDAPRRAEILPFLERLGEAGLPVLYVSHSAAEVARLAQTVLIMAEGRARAIGPTAEVFADPGLAGLFGADQAGAVLPARVAETAPDGLTRLETEAGPLFIADLAAPPGTEVRLRIHASDVMIARTRPEQISALNILPGVIERIEAEPGGRAWAQIRLGQSAILARLTQRSVAALGLAPGVACHAILKSVVLARDELSLRA